MSAVQTFGKKKTATAVAHVTPGRGQVRLNGSPISLVEPRAESNREIGFKLSIRAHHVERPPALRRLACAVRQTFPGYFRISVAGRKADQNSSTLRYKVYEPILVVGSDKFANIDVRLRVKGGGHVSQLYAIRQAIAKGLVAFYAKNEDAASALELKKTYIAYDRTLLVADPRRCEPKKFGGRGARARRQKSYR
ncbi:hypothetical protein A1Q2_03792 [Trichosporon asahii var. asahii CBS 8904]|uniref:40S ribosomal protein S16 n=1 Tax=Trichosporon asahii var. asahii (strain CBS 8904) TaxID=1220162 RepID=K1VR18_TRIAC|nr:hypothetical protein A1Q2_03792 [Trichosporon asahii var. asahii CBS 8904]